MKQKCFKNSEMKSSNSTIIPQWENPQMNKKLIQKIYEAKGLIYYWNHTKEKVFPNIEVFLRKGAALE